MTERKTSAPSSATSVPARERNDKGKTSAKRAQAELKGPTREERQAARKTHKTLRALAKLRDLGRFLTTEALTQPRKLIADLARAHYVRIWETEQAVAKYDLLPERISLNATELEQCRRILLDLGDGRWDAPGARAQWCFWGSFKPEELWELCALEPQLAAGEDPASALREYRQRSVLAELEEEIASGEPLTPEKCEAFAGGCMVEDQRGIAGDSASDLQLRRLEAFRPIAMADRHRVLPLHPTERARWMARWAFRDREDRDELMNVLFWTRHFIDEMQRAAGDWLAKRSAQLRSRFLLKTALADADVAMLRRNGLGETANVDQVRDAIRCPTMPMDQLITAALKGDATALNQALEEAGTEALDWPWVRRMIEAWREAVLGLEAKRSQTERAEARRRLGDRGIGAALSRTGMGPTPGEKREKIHRLRPMLIDFFARYQRDPGTSLPKEMATELEVSPDEISWRAKEAPAAAANDLLGDRLDLDPESVARIARRSVP